MPKPMKAELLLHQRIDHDDGAIVEMKLWRVPSRYTHRLAPQNTGWSTVVPPSGDWDRTMRAAKAMTAIFEEPKRCASSTEEQLMADFRSDVKSLRGMRQALTSVGLIETTDTGMRADYDSIETRIAI